MALGLFPDNMLKLIGILITLCAIHLWAAVLGEEGQTSAHRPARVSSRLGLASALAFAAALTWASLTFPPGIFGNDMLLVTITSIVLVLSSISSIALSLFIHVRDWRTRPNQSFKPTPSARLNSRR